MKRIHQFSIFWLSLSVGVCLLLFIGWIGSDISATSTLTYQNPSWQHWLGTDIFGRDIFSRAVYGLQIALTVGTASAIIAISIGTLLGALAGYWGGWIDQFVVWLYTTWDSIPYILLLAAFAWALGPGLVNIFIVLGLTSWITTCRLVRTEFIKQKNLDYVLAAQALGFSHFRIIFKHILPNISHIIIVQFGLCFVTAIKVEVILSFLGLGVEPGTPSWGLMIDEGKQEISRGFYWNILSASSLMFGLILSIHLLMDYWREHTDVRHSQIN